MRKFLSLIAAILFAGSMMVNATSITIPATALDLQNPTMVTEAGWNAEISYYLDKDVLVVSGLESYKSVAKQTWISQVSVGSSANTWDALAPFKGSEFYTNKSYATLQAGRYLAYLVTNCDSVWAYGYNNAATKYLAMNIYDVTGSEATSIDDATVDATYAVDMSALGKQATGVIKQALNASKTYLVVVLGTGSSNSRVFEMAFYRHPSATPEPPTPTTKDLYLKLSSDWAGSTKNFAAYYFNDTENGWSEMMSLAEGETDIYKATIPASYSKVIFVRFNGDAKTPRWDTYDGEWYVWSQTKNLTLEEGKDLFTITSGGTGKECDGTWSKYTPAEPPTPVDSTTVYFYNSLEWTTVNAFVWPAEGSAYKAWPGEAAKKETEQIHGVDVYAYTFPSSFVNVIFNNGDKQTADQKWDEKTPYFVPGAADGEGKYTGKWYAKADIPAPPTPVYNIAGQWDMTGEAWNLNELAVATDGKTATYEVELAAGDYEFKIVRILGETQSWLTKSNGTEAFGLHRKFPGVAGVTDNASNNLKVTADEGGKYVFTWTFANDSICITFPAKHLLSETWGVDKDTKVSAETKYVDNYAVVIETAYATTLKENARNFGSYAFTHAIQIRNAAYPSAETPQGTEQSGSTSLVITAKEDVDITFFYNRQTTDNTTGAAALNDGKDMIVFDQAAPTQKMDAEFRVVWMQEDKKYVNAIKTISLVKGHTYTVSAKGTTVQLSGIRYATNAEAPTPKFYIIGAGEAFGEWTHMAVYADTFEIKNLAAGDYMFRLTMTDEDWGKDYGFEQLTEKPAGVTGNADNNICFKLKEASDFKLTYKPGVGETKTVFTVEAKFYVPEMKDLFLVPGIWAEGNAKIAAWIYGDDVDDQWTGFFAPKAEKNDTLVTKINADADSIIFVRFNKDATEPKWDGGEGYIWAQMADDTIHYESMVYTITDWSKGTWDVYVPVKFYIAGSMTDWAKSIEAKADAYVFENLEAGNYKFKVVDLAENWHGFSALTDTAAGLYTDEDNNVCFTLAAKGNVTVNFVKDGEKITTFALTGTFAAPEVKLVGFFGWDPEDMMVMQDAEDHKTASLKLHLPGKDQDFKIIVANEWFGWGYDADNMYWLSREVTSVDNLIAKNKPGTEPAVQPAAIKLKADVEGVYTFTYDYLLRKLTVKFPDTYYTMYAPDWSWTLMTEKEGLWLTDTIVYAGIGVNINAQAKDENKLFYSNTVQEEGVRPIAGAEIAEKDTVYFTFNPADSVLTAVMVGKYVEPTYEHADGYYLVGYFGGKAAWDIDDNMLFLANTEKEGEYYLHNIKLAAEDSLKVVYVEKDQIKEWLPKDADNYVVDADHAGLKSIYFNPAGKGGDDWYYGTIYIAANPKYFTKYAPKWEWTLMTEKEGLWLTDTIVYAGIGVNINDVAADDKNLFYSNTAQEEGVRPIAGVEFSEKDTVYFTFNPADSVLTAVMVGKYVKPVIPMAQIKLVPGVWNQDGAKFAAVTWNVGESMENGFVSEDWFVGNDTVVGEVPAAADSIAFARFKPEATVPVLDMNLIWNHSDKLAIDKETMIYTITGWPGEGQDCSPGYWGAPYVPTLENGYYLVGNKYDWTPAAERKFKENTITAGEYYLDGIKLVAEDSIKVVYVENDQIITWYPKDAPNYVVDAKHEGVKTIYFNPEAKGGDDWYYHVIYIEENTATGIDAIDANAPAVKMLKNGMLIIEKAGIKYNSMGQKIQ